MNCILHYKFKEDQIWSISSFNQEKLHELIIPLHQPIQQRERERERVINEGQRNTKTNSVNIKFESNEGWLPFKCFTRKHWNNISE